MRLICLSLVLTVANCIAGTDTWPDTRLVTEYYDRNHDGLVDFVRHHDRDYELDWILCDTDFDGYYDLRINVGFDGQRERVHLPVERHVPITPLTKPLPKDWTSWSPKT